MSIRDKVLSLLGKQLKPYVKRSPEWFELRRKWLEKHPFCEACGGTERLEVHHIVPVHIDPSRELDETNLITLCEAKDRNCHFVFGHFHNWWAWNPNVIEDTKHYLEEKKEAYKKIGKKI